MKLHQKLNKFQREENANGTLANYFLSVDERHCLTLKKVSEECFVSSPTVFRFAKKLGYEHYSEFCYELLAEKQKEKDVSQVLYINNNENISDLFGQQFDNLLMSINDEKQFLSQEIIDEVSKVIINAKKVVIFGIGSSALCGFDFSRKLNRIQIPVRFDFDPHEQHIDSINLDKDCVALAISYSGLTKETIDKLKNAKENGAQTILISKTCKNNFTDFHIPVHSVESEFRNVTTVSRIIILLIIDLIFINILSFENEKYSKILLKTSLNREAKGGK